MTSFNFNDQQSDETAGGSRINIICQLPFDTAKFGLETTGSDEGCLAARANLERCNERLSELGALLYATNTSLALARKRLGRVEARDVQANVQRHNWQEYEDENEEENDEPDEDEEGSDDEGTGPSLIDDFQKSRRELKTPDFNRVKNLSPKKLPPKKIVKAAE